MSCKEYNFLIEENLAGTRLDKALTYLCDLSRTRLQNLVKQEQLLLNGEICSNNKHIVQLGDQIALSIPPVIESSLDPVSAELDIVFEDEYLLVVNKPAGVTTHPGAGTKNDTLVHYLLHHCKGQLSGIGGVERPGIVHRLDRYTSGLMIVAKDDKTHQNLSDQLQARTLKRTYLALVWGMVRESEGVIETQLGRSNADRTRMAVVNHGGKFARTHYRILALLAKHNMTMLECQLDTGRTHQIRVHLSHIGHSIVGDQVYGNNKRKLGRSSNLNSHDIITRQSLHACGLEFIHPQSKQHITLHADMPEDMQKMTNLVGYTGTKIQ